MLQFDLTTFIGVIINFGLVFWGFMLFFYKPVKKIIEQREDTIRVSEEKKEEIILQGELSKDLCQRSIAESEEQARIIISGANELSDEIVNKAKEDAKAQAKNMIMAAEDEINALLQTSNQLLKKQALKMAQVISNGVMSSVLTKSMDCEFILNVIENIEKTRILDKTNRLITFEQAVTEAHKANSPIVVYSAVDLPWDIKEELHKKISHIKKSTQIIEFQRNNKMAGGIIVNFGFNELDFSLSGQIQSIIEQLS
ncbi:MAG: F0F1 ATP synthase subunit delta [Caldisericia bacterium]|nr:F0F1 ATP synthase subunit delta [Caldisericia bacterium]